jgi:hypothetical protein
VQLRGAPELQGTARAGVPTLRKGVSNLSPPLNAAQPPLLPVCVQVVYRRYASLYVLAGVDADENPLAALELVHSYVEALDKFFGAVCELDIMFHLEKAHYILDEMVMNGACCVLILWVNAQNAPDGLTRGAHAPGVSDFPTHRVHR